MDLDPRHFPLASQYLSKLPEGAASYPQCQIRTDVYQDVGKAFSDLVNHPELPPLLKQYLSLEYQEQWISETVANTLMLVTRDIFFTSDSEFLAWLRAYLSTIFDKPMYRMLMHVLSTTLVVMGAAKRWSSFHRGSDLLVTEKVKKVNGRLRSVGKLVYPPHLFSGLLLDMVGATYLSALEANRAEAPNVTIERISDTETRFCASWKA